MLVMGEKGSYVDEVHVITVGAKRFFLLAVGLIGFGVRLEKEGLNNEETIFFLRRIGEGK